MNEPNKAESKPAIVQMTVSVTRAKTGKVETYELVGTAIPETPETPEPQPQTEAE
jgi:hypothetical protein